MNFNDRDGGKVKFRCNCKGNGDEIAFEQLTWPRIKTFTAQKTYNTATPNCVVSFFS